MVRISVGAVFAWVARMRVSQSRTLTLVSHSGVKIVQQRRLPRQPPHQPRHAQQGVCLLLAPKEELSVQKDHPSPAQKIVARLVLKVQASLMLVPAQPMQPRATGDPRDVGQIRKARRPSTIRSHLVPKVPKILLKSQKMQLHCAAKIERYLPWRRAASLEPPAACCCGILGLLIYYDHCFRLPNDLL